MTAAAYVTIRALFEPPAFTLLPVLWVDEYAAPPTDSGSPIPWLLVEIGFGPRMTHPGLPGLRLKRQAGLVRAFLHVPKGGGHMAALPLADAIAVVLDCQTVATGTPNEQVMFETASVVTGEDIVADRRGVYDVTMISVPFTYFHH